MGECVSAYVKREVTHSWSPLMLKGGSLTLLITYMAPLAHLPWNILLRLLRVFKNVNPFPEAPRYVFWSAPWTLDWGTPFHNQYDI